MADDKEKPSEKAPPPPLTPTRRYLATCPHRCAYVASGRSMQAVDANLVAHVVAVHAPPMVPLPVAQIVS